MSFFIGYTPITKTIRLMDRGMSHFVSGEKRSGSHERPIIGGGGRDHRARQISMVVAKEVGVSRGPHRGAAPGP